MQEALNSYTEQRVDKASPEDFIHLFLNNSERLVEFLEHLVKSDTRLLFFMKKMRVFFIIKLTFYFFHIYRWSTLIYNTLVEHYLHVWSALDNDVAKLQYEQKIVRLLQNSEARYDKDQILILCHQHNFRKGLLFLYEESKL